MQLNDLIFQWFGSFKTIISLFIRNMCGLKLNLCKVRNLFNVAFITFNGRLMMVCRLSCNAHQYLQDVNPLNLVIM